MKLLTTLGAAAVVVLAALPALAAEPFDAVDDLAATGYYVESGARSISEAGLSDVVADARNAGSRFMVAILDEEPGGGPTTFADGVLDLMADGTIIVLTRDDQVGVASTEYVRAELDDALDEADRRGGDDLTYVGNFADALVGGTAEPVSGPVSEPASSSGGGGLIVLLVIVGGLVLVVFFVVRSSNKRSRARTADELATARAEIQTQIDAMSNDILELSDRVSLAESPEAEQHFQQATEAYTAATEQFPQAEDFASLDKLAASLDTATWQLDAAEALVDGREPPPKPEARETARCFFDPAHRGPFETATLQTAAGAKEVRVCRADADRLRRGNVPEPRTIAVGGKPVPAPMAPRSRGGGGFGWMDAFSIIVGGMGSGLPVQLGRRGRRSTSRRTNVGGSSATSWPGSRPSRRTTRSTTRSSTRSRSSSTRTRSSSTRARTGRRRNR